MGIPGGGHACRDEVRGAPVRREGGGVSYTLRGRLESRLAAAALTLALALALAAAERA